MRGGDTPAMRFDTTLWCIRRCRDFLDTNDFTRCRALVRRFVARWGAEGRQLHRITSLPARAQHGREPDQRAPFPICTCCARQQHRAFAAYRGRKGHQRKGAGVRESGTDGGTSCWNLRPGSAMRAASSVRIAQRRHDAMAESTCGVIRFRSRPCTGSSPAKRGTQPVANLQHQASRRFDAEFRAASDKIRRAAWAGQVHCWADRIEIRQQPSAAI